MSKRRNNSHRNSHKQHAADHLQAYRYKPGISGNPKGRPPSRGFIAALRASVAEVTKDGRTIEQAIVDELIRQALRGRKRLQAISEIFDRLEGRPRQQVDLNDITKQLEGRSDAELLHFAQTGKWPNEVGDA